MKVYELHQNIYPTLYADQLHDGGLSRIMSSVISIQQTT